MEIVSVHFQNKKNPDEFNGREYICFTAIPVKVGDKVCVPTKADKGVAKVVKTNVDPESIGCALELLKIIEALVEEKPEAELPEADQPPNFRKVES